MRLEIRYIKDKGLKDERIVLKAKENFNIGRYLIFDSEKTEDDLLTGVILQPFWFPDEMVKVGDLVVVYSKAGEIKTKENTDGSKSHFYYRGIKNPVYIDDKTVAVLMESKDWTYVG